MDSLNVWNILAVFAAFCLIISFLIGKNATWGGLVLGVVIAIISCTIKYFTSGIFDWSLFKKIVSIVIILGSIFEIIGRMAQKVNRKH